MLLAGDIGATKAILALFSPETGPRVPLSEATFPSSRYPNLETIVHEFLSPVVGGRSEITNLSWIIDAGELQRTLNLPSVQLLNDLEAIALAIPLLEPQDLHTLNAGQLVSGGAIAVIAPGTGLGEAFLTWDGSRYRPHATEGGHADFAPTDERQIGLLRYLLQRFGHVSYERVCSGLGLPNIYAYLKDSGYVPEPAWLAEKLAAAEDPTPIIVNTALSGEEGADLCIATLDMFVSILGAEAGNLALKTLATAGVYLGGGIPPRILSALEDGRFMKAFCAKGRHASLMARMPVHVILNPKVALMGAACCGLAA